MIGIFFFLSCGTDPKDVSVIDTAIEQDTENEPQECPQNVYSAGSVENDATCQSEPLGEAFLASIGPSVSHSFSVLPITGHMNDDNGDGEMGAGDIPDILSVSDNGDGTGSLMLFDGADLALGWSSSDFEWAGYAPSSVASIASGRTPMVLSSSGNAAMGVYLQVRPTDMTSVRSDDSCYLGVAMMNGTLVTVVEQLPMPCDASDPSMSDLDQDGVPEVIYGRRVFKFAPGMSESGMDSTEVYVLGDEPDEDSYTFSMDLDQDGFQEIIAAEGIYYFSASENASEAGFEHGVLCETGMERGLPAVADLDGDGLGELVVVDDTSVGVYEMTKDGGPCTELYRWALPSTGYSPTLADFDGDTLPEIAVAYSGGAGVYEIDGATVWEALPDRSVSGDAGIGAHDMDGDQYFELVYAGNGGLIVYQGFTGEVLYSTQIEGSIAKIPLIVDSDGDDDADIVVATSEGMSLVQDSGWQDAVSLWNQRICTITNVEAGWEIPSDPAENFSEQNSFMSSSPLPVTGAELAPDLRPRVDDICQDECVENRLVLTLVVENIGALDSEGFEVAILDQDFTQIASHEDTSTLAAAVDSGGITLSIDSTGLTGLFVSVGPITDGEECSTENNLLDITTAICE
jgi:hypothetical protein